MPKPSRIKPKGKRSKPPVAPAERMPTYEELMATARHRLGDGASQSELNEYVKFMLETKATKRLENRIPYL
jgi:hypothetical protein